MNIADKAYISFVCGKHALKSKAKEILVDEKGISTVVEIIIVLAVVLIIASFFSDQITNFVSNLWKNMMGNYADDGTVTNPSINGKTQ